MKTTRTDEQLIGFLKQAEARMAIKELCRNDGLNRPGNELTPRSWKVAIQPIRRDFSVGIPPG
jgi:hypothetical protein